MQTITIDRLKSKVKLLQAQLRKARLARKWAGGLGLFFIAVDYREPSIDHTFEDLLDIFQGLESDDILEDFI